MVPEIPGLAKRLPALSVITLKNRFEKSVQDRMEQYRDKLSSQRDWSDHNFGPLNSGHLQGLQDALMLFRDEFNKFEEND